MCSDSGFVLLADVCVTTMISQGFGAIGTLHSTSGLSGICTYHWGGPSGAC